MSQSLRVFVNGNEAGTVANDRVNGGLLFSYSNRYDGCDLSAGMPHLPGAVYHGSKVEAWFAGLLPDSKRVREGMAAGRGYGANNILKLLADFGMDLPGAVQVVADENVADVLLQHGEYRLISKDSIGNRLADLLRHESEDAPRAWAKPGEHWSLGGNQTKLAFREIEDVWCECVGSAASNVIVKPGIAGWKSHALNEALCMRLARRIGLVVSDVRMATFGPIPAIVVSRYDRITDNSGNVTRLHQEDLCQALGTPPSHKYAFEGGPNSVDAMSLLAHDASGRSRNAFIDALAFNYLIAATDAHAKNYSIIHLERGRYTLAPLYDIASMAPYMQDRKRPYRTAMSIGGENRIGWLRKSSIEKFARQNDLNSGETTKRFIRIAESIQDEFDKAVEELSDAEGISELSERMAPRIKGLCSTTIRSIS